MHGTGGGPKQQSPHDRPGQPGHAVLKGEGRFKVGVCGLGDAMHIYFDRGPRCISWYFKDFVPEPD
jgi:hypothetical protein